MMEWILLITAMHMNDPEDIPARIELRFQTQEQCEQTASTLEYWIKFKQFKLETQCLKKK
jgi:hypothetical protein